MKIGIAELVVVFIVALLVLGPDKLPVYAKKLGSALREFRKASSEISKDIQENVVEPLDEVQRPIKEAIAPLNEATDQIQKDVKDISNSINGVKKPSKPAESVVSEKKAEKEDVVSDDTSKISTDEEKEINP